MTEVSFDGTLSDWRRAARHALARRYEPDRIAWINLRSAQSELPLGPSAAETGPPAESLAMRVPREFLTLAEHIACHRDESRWALLYQALWRLTQGEPHLLEMATDPLVQDLRVMEKEVHRELHHMRAFVRFREVDAEGGPWFIAWFEPRHAIVQANAPFFRDRFASMRWSILTPDECVHWDTRELTFTPGVPRSAAPTGDKMEELWRTYYASIFNPARVNASALNRHLPRHFQANLPEATLFPSLLAEAQPRAAAMIRESAVDGAVRETFGRPPIPDTGDLGVLRTAAAGCRACPLWQKATCTVFGQGPEDARIVLVGEQPGDQEDRRGQPFVGPAGQLLDRALAAAGVDRASLYLTNAVKHFKWQPRGKRRLHARPNAREIAACRPWLEAELQRLRPRSIICLGATAAQSVLRREVAVRTERGTWQNTEFEARALITIHPSALLRQVGDADPEREFDRFVADLRQMHR